jgi:hypothetical protein
MSRKDRRADFGAVEVGGVEVIMARLVSIAFSQEKKKKEPS